MLVKSVAVIGNESVLIQLPVLKYIYIYIFQIEYTKAILSNSTRKLLWFIITRMLIAVKK